MAMNENETVSAQRGVKLGRLPRKSTRKALQFADFIKYLKVPTSQTYWRKKTPLPKRSYGNTEVGDCTVAKQAVATTRMERLEQRGKLVNITDEEVKRVYFAMTQRLYGGGDTGAYEEDALDNWRNPELTFKDVDGHPYSIKAYLAVNPANQDEVRAALALAGAKGIALCINLPIAFQRLEPPAKWDVPKGQPLIGDLMPGSWGGHSMWAHGFGYTKDGGPILDSTWEEDPQEITWDAWAAYVDEVHMIIDDLDVWRQQAKKQNVVKFNVNEVREAVNAVSAIQI